MSKTTLRRLASTLLLVASTAAASLAQQPLLWGDQKNNTYKNPVLNADYSDPDVVRVNNKYYMVASDFHFMGMQVLESSDLVNWRIISQVYDRLELPGFDTNSQYGGGSWAPAIRHHNGRFYIYFCTPYEGLFMSTAEKPEGPWTPLHCVKDVKYWEDPCPFWDEDGQAYLGRSQLGAGPIIIHKMSPDGTRLLDEGVTVYEGPIAEGTKFLKRNGYYYLVIPEGGVSKGWQTVLRSKNIYGPYERRIVLEQGTTTINGPHQGALLQHNDDTWWFIHFQDTQPLGRVVHLQPARWKDDWPLVGTDIDGNGIGEPVPVWTAPTQTTTTFLPASTDEFSAEQLYWIGQKQRQLGPQWQWNHNPVDTAWNLTERQGWLTRHILPATSIKDARGTLCQKTMGYKSEATTRIDCSQLRDGDHTGLLCMGKEFKGIGVCKKGNRHIYIEDDGKRTILEPCRKIVYLRITIDSKQNIHQFSYSTDGKHYTPVGQPFSMHNGHWKGAHIGLYAYNPTESQGGKVQTDYFRYNILE